MHFLNNVSGSIGGVITPAGPENAQGIISSAYLKDPTDPQWKNDKGMKALERIPRQVLSGGQPHRRSVMYAYTVAQGLVHVLKACGDDLTRANIMKQAASIKDLELDGLLPGIRVNTSATDFAPLSQVQLERFKGGTWELFGEIMSGDVGGCQGGDTGANIMKQAASIKELELGGLLPGVKINTSATDFAPISQLQLMSSRARAGSCLAKS